MTTTQDAPLSGQTIGGVYQLTVLVGSGGFADVYLARDVRTNQVVAVKVLHAHLARDPAIVRRFMAEARDALRVVDPRVVRVLDAGSDGALQYLVMEYVQGHTLADMLAARLARGEGPFPVAEAVRIGRQVLGALAIVHEAGLVHRDVKPQNLMLTTEGVLKLMDFGVAKNLTEGTRSKSSRTIGTVEYMAPEQVLGKRSIDHRADLYAVGITLHELLSGSVPFQSDSSIGTAMLQVNEPPPPLRQHRPDVPVKLERVVLRALAKAPSERFESAAAMGAALAASIGAPRVTGPVRIGAGGSRTGRGSTWRVLVPAGAGAIVLLALLAALAAPGGTPSETASRMAAEEPSGSAGMPAAARAVQVTPPSREVITPSVAAGGSALTAATPTARLPDPTATPVPPTATPSNGELLALARQAVERGNFETAFARLADVLGRDPTAPGLSDARYAAHVGYAQTLLTQGDLDTAYAQFGEALSLRPNDPAALDGQKEVVLRKHWAVMEAAWGRDDERALAALEEIATVDLGYRDARQKLYAQLIGKADRLLAAGDRDGAYPVLMRALEVQPEAGEAHERLRTYTPTPTPRPLPPTPVPVRPQSQPQPQPQPKPQPPPPVLAPTATKVPFTIPRGGG